MRFRLFVALALAVNTAPVWQTVLAQQFGPPAPFEVQVTPRGLLTPNRANNSAGITETFSVMNIGTSTDTYTFSCWGTFNVTCTGTDKTSFTLAPTVATTVVAT